MIRRIEKLLDRFLITFMTLVASAAFIGVPAFLSYLILKKSLNKGIDLILAAGVLSILVVAYFSIVHIKTRQFSKDGDLAVPKVLYHAARVGSLLLYICAGLILIHISTFFLGKLLSFS